jgi:hypothetical protein
MGDMWFVYTAKAGANARFRVDGAMLIQLTNLNKYPLTMDGYSIEGKSTSGDWVRVPVFRVPNQGDYYFGPDLHHSRKILWLSSKFHLAAYQKTIRPGESISGWSVLGESGKTLTGEYRIRVRDSYGTDFTATMLPPLDVAGLRNNTRFELHYSDPTYDISAYPVGKIFEP